MIAPGVNAELGRRVRDRNPGDFVHELVALAP
jgi:hypothetical protein